MPSASISDDPSIADTNPANTDPGLSLDVIMQTQLLRYSQDLVRVYRNNREHADWLAMLVAEYREVIDLLPSALAVTCAEGVIQRANSKWATWTGRSASPVGMHLAESLQGLGLGDVIAHVTKRGGSASTPRQFAVMVPTNPDWPLQAIVNPRQKDGGYVVTLIPDPLEVPVPTLNSLVHDAMAATRIPLLAAGITCEVPPTLPQREPYPNPMALFLTLRQTLETIASLPGRLGVLHIDAGDDREEQVFTLGIPVEATQAHEEFTDLEALFSLSRSAAGTIDGECQVRRLGGSFLQVTLVFPRTNRQPR